MRRHLYGLCALLIVLMLAAGCTYKTQEQNTGELKVQDLFDAQLMDTKENALPLTARTQNVIVQDYADNDTSKAVIDQLAFALNEEAAAREYNTAFFGHEVFIIQAAIPFENGALICGRILHDGENPPELFYIENGQITHRTQSSDVWSLNYTVFKGHTIAYGSSLERWDNACIMQQRVSVQFANGESGSVVFGNRPYHNQKKHWDNAEVTTDGYILTANAHTWVQSLDFYGHDGRIDDECKMDLFDFGRIWAGQPNEAWNQYHFCEMLTQDEWDIILNTSSPDMRIDGDSVMIERFLMTEGDIAYIWRNSNAMPSMYDVQDADKISFADIREDDALIWVALDQDDGSPDTDVNSLLSSSAPQQKGHYCVIVKRPLEPDAPHAHIYFSIFFALV